MNVKHNHPILETPLYGEGSLWQMGTVTKGKHKGRHVCILVEFADGRCICDMGEGKPIKVINRNILHLWNVVEGDIE